MIFGPFETFCSEIFLITFSVIFLMCRENDFKEFINLVANKVF